MLDNTQEQVNIANSFAFISYVQYRYICRVLSTRRKWKLSPDSCKHNPASPTLQAHPIGGWWVVRT